MSYENVRKINIIGRPELPVPTGFTVEQILNSLNINLSSYESEVNGDTLVLRAPSGTKGIVDGFLTEEGKFLPNGGHIFTREDVKRLDGLFPNEDLFKGLTEPATIQRYLDALKADTEARLADLSSAIATERRNGLDKLIAVLSEVRVLADNQDSVFVGQIFSAVDNLTEQVTGYVELAKAEIVELALKAEQDAHREQVLTAMFPTAE